MGISQFASPLFPCVENSKELLSLSQCYHTNQHICKLMASANQETISDEVNLGPIRSSRQVLNVITFLTKTNLSRQARDILKKTKGVIISTIALHVLLASLYISRHGRLV